MLNFIGTLLKYIYLLNMFYSEYKGSCIFSLESKLKTKNESFKLQPFYQILKTELNMKNIYVYIKYLKIRIFYNI